MPVGIGWRQPHEQALLAQRPALGFIEVHAENFFAEGGAALATLLAARQHYPVSLHGVGLGLGSAAGLDAWHLDQLARLVQVTEPMLVSDHACFARAPLRPGQAAVHASDLLPLAFTDAALDILVANVQRVQERLRRPILVENISAYLRWADEGWPEPDFLNALAQRSGCQLLLDVNNLVVNALNAGSEGDDPLPAVCAWIDAIAPQAVGQMHLAGHAHTAGLVVDDHGSRVPPVVWQAYAHALRHLGPRPTLVEWDTRLPSFEVLLGEAEQAAQHLAALQAAPQRLAAQQTTALPMAASQASVQPATMPQTDIPPAAGAHARA